MMLCAFVSKEEGKDQEPIQSSTTPDRGHHMTKTKNIRKKRQNIRKHHTQESQEANPFQAGDHKAAKTDKTA